MDNTAAIILAAGAGTRMRSTKPKVLHEVLGLPLLTHVLRTVKSAGIDRILVVVGHGKDDVISILPDGVESVHQVEQLGTGDAVKVCRESLSDFEGDILVLCGDAPAVSTTTLENLHRAHLGIDASVSVLTACLQSPGSYGRIVRDESNEMTGIVEMKDATPEQQLISEINSGAYFFKAERLWSALDRLKSENAAGEYYLTDTVRILLTDGENATTYMTPVGYEIQGVNTQADLVALNNVLRLQVLQRLLEEGVAIVDPSSTFVEMDVSIGEGTVIHPFSVIRAGVQIGQNCAIGPFAHLGPGAVLEDGAEIGNFVEVKRSTVGAGSKAKHLAYLGDALLGRNVNIGAGTITANYDGKNKNTTELGDGVHTGSNTVLVAPVKVGARAKTGAGSVVTARQEIAEDSVVAGVPARPIQTGVNG